MLKSLFGSSKRESSIPQELASIIEQYRSEIFSHGLLAVASDVSMQTKGDVKNIALTVPFTCHSEVEKLRQFVFEESGQKVTFSVNTRISEARSAANAIPNVKNVIAIASGKGGVGKSTCTVNLALALQKEGAKVGVLDADIYGPSIPIMLGKPDAKPESDDGKSMHPIICHDIASMSLGYLVDPNDAAVWRGPMASSALMQLLNETNWPELDYLLIDMPPGTGDIQLTLTQKIPVTAAIVVTTPQNIALADAIKGVAMFEKVNVPVLGIIENMSFFVCSACGAEDHVFGYGGGESLAEGYAVPMLGQVPLNTEIREAMDKGNSAQMFESASVVGECYRTIAQKLSSTLYYQWDKYSPAVAEIIITDD